MMKANELRKVIANAKKDGKTVSVKTQGYSYTNVECTSKTGNTFMGFDADTGRPHRFHYSAVRSVETV